MKWTRFTIHTCVDAVDILSYELDAIGVEGIEIEDNIPLSEEDKQKMFVDILPEPTVSDDTARVHFYKDEADCNPEEILLQVQSILADVGTYTRIGEGRVTVSSTEDKDWINNWKEFFKPFRASDRIAIVPRWMDDNEKPDGELLRPADGCSEAPHILRIDPGIAFGTGSHETTKLCIRAIDRFIHVGDRVLDIGCGSGILSIVALLLGASYATALDIDETAVRVARENFDANALSPDTYELLAGNLLADEAFVQDIERRAAESDGYDIVTANILPDVIVPLTPLVPSFLKNNGVYITSGILATREAEVRAAMEEAGFRDITCTPMGEWVSLTGIR